MGGGASELDPRRSLPSLDALLRRTEASTLVSIWGIELVTEALREVLYEIRGGLEVGGSIPEAAALLRAAQTALESDRVSLRPVVNATGVILHTNLGRAPLPECAAREAERVARGYSSLEYDLSAGGRGDRYEHCADLVSRLTGSEAALVVNNNAAAVSLAINSLARGRDVVVSRGELVEIGGGFRLPDVIERSGAFLRAVGTTNRTRLDDYRRALTPSTGLLLKVHPSNYRVEGFTEAVSLTSLVELGRSVGLPVLHDVGSGLMFREPIPGLAEPTVMASVAAGADLVTWSGDKLFGGPQSGIIHGRSDLVDRLRSNPLLRAFRVDKMTLAALESTLRLYRSPARVGSEVPVLRMLTRTSAEIEERARVARSALSPEAARGVTIVPVLSVLGGGSAPGFEIASSGWALSGAAGRCDAFLRGQDPPVVGRIAEGSLLLDFRTLLDGQESLLIEAVERLTREGLLAP